MSDPHPSPWSTHVPQAAYGSPYAGGSASAGPSGPYGAPPAVAPGWAGPPIEVRVVAPAPAGRGLAIVGVVLGGLAVLGMLVVGVLVLGGKGEDSGPGGYGPVRGTIAPTGRGLTGAALAAEVTTKVADDGGEPEGVVCPETTKVAQDVTTVCHGTDYGEDSAFVVLFEDAQGAYTLLEI